MDKIGSAVAASSGNKISSLKHNNLSTQNTSLFRPSFMETAVEPLQEKASGPKQFPGEKDAPVQFS